MLANHLRNEEGSVTVFLSLTFLFLAGFILCVIGGMHIYGEIALAEDAVGGAGDYVNANYDKELFRRYHIFFLDPREKELITSDGKQYINHYLDKSSFYSFSCDNISVSEEQSVVDWDGKYLKSEIREYMKYQSIKDGAGALLSLVKEADKKEDDAEEMGSKVEHISNEPSKEEIEKREEYNGVKKEENEEDEDTGEKKKQLPEKVDPEVQKKRIVWKDFKNAIEIVKRSGTLIFVTSNCESLSNLSIQTEGLPSVKYAGSTSAKKEIKDPDFSLSNVHTISNLTKSGLNLKDAATTLSDDLFVYLYIDDYFRHFNQEEDSEKRALQYEVEYLIGGKSSDQENLHYVVNRLILIRFLTNFAHALGSDTLKSEVEGVAIAVSLATGFPIAEKAFKYIILGALAYGESMVDVRTLCSGGEVPITKKDSTWNLHLLSFGILLDSSYMSKEGSENVSYEDYLKLLLLGSINKKTLYYRMMDLMQENVKLVEPEFSMEGSLFSFTWNVNMKGKRWFSHIPFLGLSDQDLWTKEYMQTVTY